MRSYLAYGAFGKRTPGRYWEGKKRNSVIIQFFCDMKNIQEVSLDGLNTI